MTKTVLIVGGSGQIGAHLARVFSASGWTPVLTHHESPQTGMIRLDIGDSQNVRAVIEKVQPWMVINSANVKGGTDACELDPRLAKDLHFGGAKNLVDGARLVKARFIQISTDYVFDGKAGPYSEEDSTNPLSKLGQAKLDAENYALDQLDHALIIRTSFVFSWAPWTKMKNFVMQILENNEKKKSMIVPIDQVGNITYAPNISEALLEMTELGAKGLYHVAGTTRLSKYDWALKVCEFFGLDKTLIKGITTEELKQAGPRPLESGFRLNKVQNLLKKTKLQSLQESLELMKSDMNVEVAQA